MSGLHADSERPPKGATPIHPRWPDADLAADPSVYQSPSEARGAGAATRPTTVFLVAVAVVLIGALSWQYFI